MWILQFNKVIKLFVELYINPEYQSIYKKKFKIREIEKIYSESSLKKERRF